MSQFYIVENQNRIGPFTPEALRARGISPTTLVWREGMANWAAASTVPELSFIFAAPQPYQGYPQAGYTPQGGYPQGGYGPQQRLPRPKTWMAEAILVTLFCCLPFGIVAIIKASGVDSAYASGRMADAMMASNDARKWVMWSFWSAIICWVLYILIYVVFLGALFMI